MNDIVSEKFKALPELLSSHDLVDLGLFRSPTAAYLARLRGYSPDYIKIGNLVKYPKSKVLEFIQKQLQNGSKMTRSKSAHNV